MRMMNGYFLQIDLFDLYKAKSSDSFRLEHDGFSHFGAGDGAAAVRRLFMDFIAEFRTWETGWFAVRAYLTDGRDGVLLCDLVRMDRKTFAEYEEQTGQGAVASSLIAALPMKIFEADLHETAAKMADRPQEEK